MDSTHSSEVVETIQVPNQPLNDREKELLSFARTEFSDLRGEINHRINLQNAAIQRALSLFGITATIAVAFFAALVRTRISNDTNQTLLSDSELLLMGKAAFVLVVAFCFINMLLVCNWIYQLYMVLRIDAYTGWLGREVEAILHPSRSLVFRYARCENKQPWKAAYDRKRFRYLQVFVLYTFIVLPILSLIAMSFGLWNECSKPQRVIGVVFIVVLVLLLPVLLWIHISLHHVQDNRDAISLRDNVRESNESPDIITETNDSCQGRSDDACT